MPTTVSTSMRHHGKRHRFAVTAKDETPEALQAASKELDEQVRRFQEQIAPKVERQSYTKRKERQRP